MAIFTSTSSYSDPIRALSIKALEKRLADVQANAQEAPASMPSPWQGAAHVMGKVGEGLQLGRSEGALAAQRQALAQAMGRQQPDGSYAPEDVATITGADPEVGRQIMTQIATARENAANRQAEMERARLAAETQTGVANIQGTTARDTTGMTVAGQRDVTNIQGQTSRDVTGMQGTTARDVADTQGRTARDVADTQGQTSRDVTGMQGQTQRDVAGTQAQSAGSVAALQGQTARDVEAMRGDTALAVAGKQGENTLATTKLNNESARKIEELKQDYLKNAPQSDQGKIMHDARPGGPLSATQAADALRAKGTDAGMLKLRGERANEHITTVGRLDDLREAKELLKQGIHHGIFSKTEAEFAANGWYGDEEKGRRTLRYNNIADMDAVQAMSKALTGQTTDQEMNRFITDLNNKSLSAQQKMDIIDKMTERGLMFYESQRTGLKEAGADPDTVVRPEKQPRRPGQPDTGGGGGGGQLTPEEKAQSLDNAKAAIAAGKVTREAAIAKLKAAGVDPGGL